MEPERWKQIDQLLEAALDRPPGERAAFLNQACAGDATLRREVEALLSSDGQASSFIESPAFEAAAELLVDRQAESLVGQSIGHYKVLSLLGTGGMGEVYLAQDSRLGRQVALKLLPASFTNDQERVRRFEQEARAASRLSHPNICVIHEVGETDDGRHFITMEYIDGVTLRQHMVNPQMRLGEALDIAIQAASGLSAAHQAGIVHRDVKPENIMLRTDSYIKVLDFGLAKLTERQQISADTESPAIAVVKTDAGVVMGTASYMSPEQARGLEVDARTDIWGLGVVLYEMVAGRAPFEGETTSDVIVSILEREPLPLEHHRSGVPTELQKSVSKTLSKNREDRYQTVEELVIDLKSLKRELEYRSRNETADELAKRTSGRRLALALAGRETAIIAIAALLLLAAAWFFLNRKTTPALAEREPLLLADFENKTGEDIWDGTLKQALAIALEQSPYMNIFPEARARSAMRLMNRSVDEPITRAIGREICQRRNVRALLVGTITKLERSYTMTLEATDAQSGETIARTLEQATGRDEVVNALGRAAKDLRGKLGESLASLRKYDAPLVEATTSSLEALKAYSTGWRALQNGRTSESYSFFRRAIELDEQFALARTTLGSRLRTDGAVSEGVEQMEKAWRLREKVSEYERLRINCDRYLVVTGESDKAIEEALILMRTYPQNSGGFNHLGNSYERVGQHTKAEEAFREGFRLQPEYNVARINAGNALLMQNRYDGAKELYGQVLVNAPEILPGHFYLAYIAHAQNKTEELSRQIEWFAGKPSLFQGQLLQARLKASAGQRGRAYEFYLQAAQLAGARNQIENQIGLLSEGASVNALFGQTAKAAEQSARALSIQRNGNYLLKGHFYGNWTRTFVGWVFALSGDAARAQSLTDELVRENPKNTLILSVIAPLTRATIELQRGAPTQAIELLQPAIPYEAAPDSSLFRPNWIRGRAYLQLKQGAAAAAEFQKIIDHRGWDVTSPLWPLAHLGLARAAVLQGDKAKAKQMYDEFFRLWKDADAGLPALIEAKKEYERLK